MRSFPCTRERKCLPRNEYRIFASPGFSQIEANRTFTTRFMYAGGCTWLIFYKRERDPKSSKETKQSRRDDSSHSPQQRGICIAIKLEDHVRNSENPTLLPCVFASPRQSRQSVPFSRDYARRTGSHNHTLWCHDGGTVLLSTFSLCRQEPH